jgi:UDP-N-acetylmuramate--alanine ligase
MFGRVSRVHFVGIGGIGMSGIAEVLLNMGYPVSGSDVKASASTRRLEPLGARICIGHDAANLGDAEVVVYSSAVRPDNPELVLARQRKIPVIPRAEMLAELMRLKFSVAVAGAHGKTTTTSLVAQMLAHAEGFDPTIVVGGRLLAMGTNAKLGKGDYLVAEADESDGSFLHLLPTIAVITNIDAEHLDHYTNLEAIQSAFVEFANKVPFYGSVVLCLDDANARAILSRLEKRALTYGMEPEDGSPAAADVSGRILESGDEGTRFEVRQRGRLLGEARVRMPGDHNVLNALAAITVGLELEVPFAQIARSLEEFLGVARRFEIRAVEHDVVFVDDYGHHPTEIAATLRAAKRNYTRRLVVVFQPHRYTRTKFLLSEFGRAFFDADVLFLADIYAASEDPIPGVDSDLLARTIRQRGHQSVTYVPDKEQLTAAVASSIQPGDLVLTLGAGDVSSWNDEIVDRWRRRVEAGMS